MEAEFNQQRAAAAGRGAPTPTPATGGADTSGAAVAPPDFKLKDWLGYSVKLLAGLPAESLAALQAAPKKVAVYRAVRSQRFLEFTEEDLRAREAKQLETWRALTARRGKVHAGCIFGCLGGS
jgi:hypothetical protein